MAKRTSANPRTKSAKKSSKQARQGANKPGTPRLLTGGNPQIPKGDGDAPVRAYLNAMPGWKRALGKKLDAIVEREVTKGTLRRAVRWNTPFYGTGDNTGWFLSLNCCTNYVKVAFFAGTSLSPMPPVESKVKGVRYLHLFETWGNADEVTQFVEWVRQASRLPGMTCFGGGD